MPGQLRYDPFTHQDVFVLPEYATLTIGNVRDFFMDSVKEAVNQSETSQEPTNIYVPLDLEMLFVHYRLREWTFKQFLDLLPEARVKAQKNLRLADLSLEGTLFGMRFHSKAPHFRIVSVGGDDPYELVVKVPPIDYNDRPY